VADDNTLNIPVSLTGDFAKIEALKKGFSVPTGISLAGEGYQELKALSVKPITVNINLKIGGSDWSKLQDLIQNGATINLKTSDGSSRSRTPRNIPVPPNPIETKKGESVAEYDRRQIERYQQEYDKFIRSRISDVGSLSNNDKAKLRELGYLDKPSLNSQERAKNSRDLYRATKQSVTRFNERKPIDDPERQANSRNLYSFLRARENSSPINPDVDVLRQKAVTEALRKQYGKSDSSDLSGLKSQLSGVLGSVSPKAVLGAIPEQSPADVGAQRRNKVLGELRKKYAKTDNQDFSFLRSISGPLSARNVKDTLAAIPDLSQADIESAQRQDVLDSIRKRYGGRGNGSNDDNNFSSLRPQLEKIASRKNIIDRDLGKAANAIPSPINPAYLNGPFIPPPQSPQDARRIEIQERKDFLRQGNIERAQEEFYRSSLFTPREKALKNAAFNNNLLPKDLAHLGNRNPLNLAQRFDQSSTRDLLFSLLVGGGGGLGKLGGVTGSVVGTAIGGPGGGLIGSLAGQFAGEKLSETFNQLTESFRSATEAGKAFQQSVTSIGAVLNNTTEIASPAGGDQFALQTQRAREFQLEARKNLLPFGIAGQSEVAVAQGLATGLVPRVPGISAQQFGKLAGALGATSQVLRPDLAQNPTRYLKDVEDLSSGNTSAARRTELGIALNTASPGFIEKLANAQTSEDIDELTKSLQGFQDALSKTSTGSRQLTVIAGVFDKLLTAFGDKLLDSQVDGLKKLVDVLTDEKLTEDAEALGDALGKLASSIESALAGVLESVKNFTSGVSGAVSLPGHLAEFSKNPGPETALSLAKDLKGLTSLGDKTDPQLQKLREYLDGAIEKFSGVVKPALEAQQKFSGALKSLFQQAGAGGDESPSDYLDKETSSSPTYKLAYNDAIRQALNAPAGGISRNPLTGEIISRNISQEEGVPEAQLKNAFETLKNLDSEFSEKSKNIDTGFLGEGDNGGLRELRTLRNNRLAGQKSTLDDLKQAFSSLPAVDENSSFRDRLQRSELQNSISDKEKIYGKNSRESLRSDISEDKQELENSHQLSNAIRQLNSTLTSTDNKFKSLNTSLDQAKAGLDELASKSAAAYASKEEQLTNAIESYKKGGYAESTGIGLNLDVTDEDINAIKGNSILAQIDQLRAETGHPGENRAAPFGVSGQVSPGLSGSFQLGLQKDQENAQEKVVDAQSAVDSFSEELDHSVEALRLFIEELESFTQADPDKSLRRLAEQNPVDLRGKGTPAIAAGGNLIPGFSLNGESVVNPLATGATDAGNISGFSFDGAQVANPLLSGGQTQIGNIPGFTQEGNQVANPLGNFEPVRSVDNLVKDAQKQIEDFSNPDRVVGDLDTQTQDLSDLGVPGGEPVGSKVQKISSLKRVPRNNIGSAVAAGVLQLPGAGLTGYNPSYGRKELAENLFGAFGDSSDTFRPAAPALPKANTNLMNSSFQFSNPAAQQAKPDAAAAQEASKTNQILGQLPSMIQYAIQNSLQTSFAGAST
jgi:hypothetical protein